MSTVRERIDLFTGQGQTSCRNILFRDPVHDRQVFLDRLRQRRQCLKRQTRGDLRRERIELTIAAIGLSALVGLLSWFYI